MIKRLETFLDDVASRLALKIIERLIVPDQVVKIAVKQTTEVRDILEKSNSEMISRIKKIEAGLGTLRCLACGSYSCRAVTEVTHGLAMLHCSYCDAAYELKGPRYGAKFER